VNQTICPVGHYCENVAARPVACIVDTYSEEEGAVSILTCKLCSRFFSSTSGSANCGILNGWWLSLFLVVCLFAVCLLSAMALHLVPKALGNGMALGLACLSLLLVVVGLALPMYVYDESIQRSRCTLRVAPFSCRREVSYGIRDISYTSRETGEMTVVNMWDIEADGDVASGIRPAGEGWELPPEVRSFVTMNQAAFAMAFLGMLVNLCLLIPCCAKATGYCTACVSESLGSLKANTGIGAGQSVSRSGVISCSLSSQCSVLMSS